MTSTIAEQAATAVTIYDTELGAEVSDRAPAPRAPG